MSERSLKFVPRVGRPIRRVLSRLKAVFTDGFDHEARRNIDALICRPNTSGDEVAAKLAHVYAMRPELHEAFPGGAGSDEFWRWANVEGFFEHDELQFALAPIPPTRLIRYFSYEKSSQNFAWTGALHYSVFQKLLQKHGLSFNAMKAVLDFGCGAGRLGRLFANGAGRQRYVGCDVSAPSIHYLQRTMGFGEFQVGFLQPPLPFADASLDAIFSLSVFTHLTEAAMHRWLAEFRRILKPGGVVLQTTLGNKAMFQCNAVPFGWRSAVAVADEPFQRLRQEFAERGFGWAPHNMAVTGGEAYGIAFQTEQYIAREWTRGFELVEVVPAGIDAWQDVVLLRKPDGLEKKSAPPILPAYAPSGLPSPEGIVLHAPKKVALGARVKVQATVSGATDVHYRFGLRKNNWHPAATEWQREPSATFFATSMGLFHLQVEAVSGSGFHMVPQVVASDDLIVEPAA